MIASAKEDMSWVMDLVIRNGTVITAGEISQTDVGIEGEIVTQIGRGLGPAPKRLTPTARICFLAESMSTPIWTLSC